MSMLEVRDAVVAEVESIGDLVGRISDRWDTSTTCDGWSVGHVGTHVGHAMVTQGQAFENMLAGSDQTPDWVEPDHEGPDGARASVARGVDAVRATMGKVGDRHAESIVPLPVGAFPTPGALDIVLLEYGAHHWDIAHALDPSATLSDAAAGAILRLAPGLIAFLGPAAPAEPMGYRIEAPSLTLDVSGDPDGGWVLEPRDEVTPTTISGDDAAVALFALGRIGADDPSITADGPAAADFKTYFPGP